MDDKINKYLFDIDEAAKCIRDFTKDKSYAEYENDQILKAAVERKFEIIGEALNRIKKEDETVLEKIRDFRDIVSFRNILNHAYDHIDDRIVWDVIENNITNLLEDVNKLLK